LQDIFVDLAECLHLSLKLIRECIIIINKNTHVFATKYAVCRFNVERRMSMKRIKIAVVGYGNIGKFAVQAAEHAPDMEISGIVRRASSLKKPVPPEISGYRIVSSIKELGKVDVAVLCVPTRSIPETAREILSMGINTVDSYDIHGQLWDVKQELDPIARQNNAVAIISSGWDPGSDSVIRALLQALVPKGITYTNFGPGMSMGHTVAAKAIDGVKDALSMTIPLGTGVHRRMVYIELEKGAVFSEVERAIKTDEYFIKDETTVTQVEDVSQLVDMGHGVFMERKGVSGATHNQLLEFKMRINNPALTGQVLISVARASVKQKPGAYTMLEIPVIDLLYGDKGNIIKSLV
jgi:diaminopimelate dehydrogenase